jgi:hypothetical protein
MRVGVKLSAGAPTNVSAPENCTYSSTNETTGVMQYVCTIWDDSDLDYEFKLEGVSYLDVYLGLGWSVGGWVVINGWMVRAAISMPLSSPPHPL